MSCLGSRAILSCQCEQPPQAASCTDRWLCKFSGSDGATAITTKYLQLGQVATGLLPAITWFAPSPGKTDRCKDKKKQTQEKDIPAYYQSKLENKQALPKVEVKMGFKS